MDSSIAAYQKTQGISGNLSSVGSDTLNNLMTFWTEKFREFYPNVNIQVEGKGSSTAPPALISSVSQLGPMSRQMKSSEIDKFEKKYHEEKYEKERNEKPEKELLEDENSSQKERQRLKKEREDKTVCINS